MTAYKFDIENLECDIAYCKSSNAEGASSNNKYKLLSFFFSSLKVYEKNLWFVCEKIDSTGNQRHRLV